MSDQKDTEWLEKMMSESAYVEDGGFSDQLMSALPPPRAWRRRRRNVLVGLSTLVGLVFAMFGLGGAQVLGRAFVDLGVAIQTQSIPVLSLAVLLSLVGAALVVAWRSVASVYT